MRFVLPFGCSAAVRYVCCSLPYCLFSDSYGSPFVCLPLPACDCLPQVTRLPYTLQLLPRSRDFLPRSGFHFTTTRATTCCTAFYRTSYYHYYLPRYSTTTLPVRWFTTLPTVLAFGLFGRSFTLPFSGHTTALRVVYRTVAFVTVRYRLLPFTTTVTVSCYRFYHCYLPLDYVTFLLPPITALPAHDYLIF